MKKIIVAILTVIMLLPLIACGNGSSNRTLSEYLRKESTAIFYVGEAIKKDEIPWIFFCRNNQLTYVFSLGLTWGELSKLSDEEIIKKAIEFADGDEDKFYDSFDDYVLCIMTDDTGNVVKEEAMVYKHGWLNFITETSGVVYDSYYYGYKDDYGCVVVRCKENTIPFILDDVNSEGVEIDISPEEVQDSLLEDERNLILQQQLEQLTRDSQD
ncbi:MAG: hypothetical protein HDR20_10810 [Lachnospiraceae bacterium]|nr:hypothetical protein [Lachnospiraceae bacterium]